MAPVFEECTTEEHRSVVGFLWAKGLNTKHNRKELFLCTMGSVCRLKWFTAGWQNFADNKEVETEVWK
jgi:hypothetical protein